MRKIIIRTGGANDPLVVKIAGIHLLLHGAINSAERTHVLTAHGREPITVEAAMKRLKKDGTLTLVPREDWPDLPAYTYYVRNI